MGRFHGLDGRMGRGAAMAADPFLTFCREQLEGLAAEVGKRIAAFDRLLARIAGEPARRPTLAKLTAIPGVGMLTALQVALEAPDMSAFKNSGAFASYTGLCPGEYSSGAARRQGHITRRGPGPLRGALIQCAWAAVRGDGATKARYAVLSKRLGKKRAIVAVARRLAVRIWWKLREPDGAAAA